MAFSLMLGATGLDLSASAAETEMGLPLLPGSEDSPDGNFVRFSDLRLRAAPTQIENYLSSGKTVGLLQVQQWEGGFKSLARFQRWRQDGRRWVRGEFEQESVLRTLLTLVRIELASVRNERPQLQKQTWDELISFAAELAYAEASPVGLRLAHTLRSLVFDEMDLFEKRQTHIVAHPDWIQWAQGLRAPWPVDRVILMGSQRLPAELALPRKQLQSVLKTLQQNLHQPLKTLLGEKHPLQLFWTEKDIQLMQQELVRRAAYQVRWAQQAFEKLHQRKPQDVQELVSRGLLTSVPVNYRTGRPFQLAEARQVSL